MTKPIQEMAEIMAEYKAALRHTAEQFSIISRLMDEATDVAANRLQNLYFEQSQLEGKKHEDKRGKERGTGTSAGGVTPSGLRRSDRPGHAVQSEVQP
tara:strand:+ start:722 stop:1015 length:294 start_codon:yes stop_codon:yes gene_type:complete